METPEIVDFLQKSHDHSGPLSGITSRAKSVIGISSYIHVHLIFNVHHLRIRMPNLIVIHFLYTSHIICCFGNLTPSSDNLLRPARRQRGWAVKHQALLLFLAEERISKLIAPRS